jgi:DNA-binding NtrC family response regulator
MALGIVQAHGGFVDVISKLGEGTEFRVFIPASDIKFEGRDKETARELPAGSGEIVLVVDRDLAILEAHKRTLEAYGYSVLTAIDSREAVQLCGDNNGRIKVILSDLAMLDPSGRSMVRILRELDPEVKIIATASLNSTRNAAVDARECGVSGLLIKPYTPEILLRQLSDTLQSDSVQPLTH